MRYKMGIILLSVTVLMWGAVAWLNGGHNALSAENKAETEHSNSHEGHGGHNGESESAHAAHSGESESAHDAHSEEGRIVVLTDAQMKTNGVKIAQAGPGELSTQLALTGEVRLNADRVAHVVPRVAGVVREVRRSIGDEVKAGEVMAVLESRELASIKAAYLAAKERETLAQATFNREKRLWEKKISAEQDYLSSKQALAEAVINRRSAEQQLHSVGFSEEYLKEIPGQAHLSYTRYEITAPFNGVVIEKHITLGESLKDDAPCFTVADLNTVWVNLSVYQKDIPAIRKGQEVVISADGNHFESVNGRVDYIGPVMGEETRTAIARVVLSNKTGQWRPGQFVTGSVHVKKDPVAILVPKTAIQTPENTPSVFIKTDKGFIPAPVTVGRGNDTHVEIMEGLVEGQQYAATGTFIMKAMLEKSDVHNH